MNSSTRTLLREIQAKLKSPITKEREFENESGVIDYAVKTLYDLLKKQRLSRVNQVDGWRQSG